MRLTLALYIFVLVSPFEVLARPGIAQVVGSKCFGRVINELVESPDWNQTVSQIYSRAKSHPEFEAFKSRFKTKRSVIAEMPPRTKPSDASRFALHGSERFTDDVILRYFESAYPAMTERRRKQALHLIRDAEGTKFDPVLIYDYGAPDADNPGFTVGRADLDFFPELVGHPKPYFGIAKSKKGGNSQIYLVMDADGKPFVLKDPTFDQGQGARERVLLERGKQLGSDLTVEVLQPVKGPTTGLAGDAREYLRAESDLQELLDFLQYRYKKDPSKENFNEIIRLYYTTHQFATDLARKQIPLQFDFKLGEVLIVQNGDGHVIKLTDFGGSSSHFADDVSNARRITACLKRNRSEILDSLRGTIDARRLDEFLLGSLAPPPNLPSRAQRVRLLFGDFLLRNLPGIYCPASP